MTNQKKLTRLREIYDYLKRADYKNSVVYSQHSVSYHLLQNDALFQEMGKLLEGMLWDEPTIWKHNE